MAGCQAAAESPAGAPLDFDTNSFARSGEAARFNMALAYSYKLFQIL